MNLWWKLWCSELHDHHVVGIKLLPSVQTVRARLRRISSAPRISKSHGVAFRKVYIDPLIVVAIVTTSTSGRS